MNYPALRSCTRICRLRHALSLIELMVVLAVVGILSSVVAVTVKNTRSSARTIESMSNIRSLCQAALSYSADNNGMLPAPNNVAGAVDKYWPNALYQFIYNRPWPNFVPFDTGENLRGSVFYCPFIEESGEGAPMRSYGWNIFLKNGTDQPNLPAGPLHNNALVDPARTIMAATSRNTSGISPYSNMGTFSSRAGGKVLAGFADGHTEMIAISDIPVNATDPQSYFWIGYR